MIRKAIVNTVAHRDYTSNGSVQVMLFSDRLEVRYEDYFREAYLIPALTAGIIEMTMPDKPNSRLQKYRLTQKGRDLITKLPKDTGNSS